MRLKSLRELFATLSSKKTEHRILGLKSLRDQSRHATKKQVGILRDKGRKVTALKSKPVRVHSHNVFQSESTIREQLSMRDVFAERSALWSPVPATERETIQLQSTREGI